MSPDGSKSIGKRVRVQQEAAISDCTQTHPALSALPLGADDLQLEIIRAHFALQNFN
jgi:hypothetical protein